AGGNLVKYKNGVFSNMTSANTYSIVKVFFFDETEGWTISNADVQHYVSNGWTTVSSDQVLVKDFVFTDKNNGLLIGPPYFGGGAGGVISQYSGGTFARVPNFDFTQNFIGIKMFSATQGIIVGEAGLVLRIGEKAVVTSIESNIFTRGVANMTYSVVPNPASQSINIYKEGTTMTNEHVMVNTIDGVVVMDQVTSDGHLDISSLNKGMYFIRLLSDHTTLKFIKE
ncbi:MAG TPA: T9SS type A sorting domain-containing protein, partial [Cytophagaceae bacterium]|nr:T9SS type A sorting domain-containing protein [Cytophagaceae bacterium]